MTSPFCRMIFLRFSLVVRLTLGKARLHPYAICPCIPWNPWRNIEKHMRNMIHTVQTCSDQTYPWIQHLHICIHLNLWVSTWVGDQGVGAFGQLEQTNPGIHKTVSWWLHCALCVQLVFRARYDRCEMVTRHNLFLLWVRGWQSLMLRMLPDATLDVPRTATMLEAHSRDGWQKKTWWKQIIYIYLYILDFVNHQFSNGGFLFCICLKLVGKHVQLSALCMESPHGESESDMVRGTSGVFCPHQIMAMRWVPMVAETDLIFLYRSSPKLNSRV